MDITDAERALLAERITAERMRQFGTKSGAYTAAGINAATWSNLEKGSHVRPDRLIAAVRLLWPASGGDWRAVSDRAAPQRDVEQWVAEIEARVEALERAHDKEDTDGRDTAPTTQAGVSPALGPDEVVRGAVDDPGQRPSGTPAGTAIPEQPPGPGRRARP